MSAVRGDTRDAANAEGLDDRPGGRVNSVTVSPWPLATQTWVPSEATPGRTTAHADGLHDRGQPTQEAGAADHRSSERTTDQ